MQKSLDLVVFEKKNISNQEQKLQKLHEQLKLIQKEQVKTKHTITKNAELLIREKAKLVKRAKLVSSSQRASGLSE